MSNHTRRCPVCGTEVAPTRIERNICGHLNKANNPCEIGTTHTLPFDLAIRHDPPPTQADLTALMAQIHDLSRRRP